MPWTRSLLLNLTLKNMAPNFTTTPSKNKYTTSSQEIKTCIIWAKHGQCVVKFEHGCVLCVHKRLSPSAYVN